MVLNPKDGDFLLQKKMDRNRHKSDKEYEARVHIGHKNGKSLIDNHSFY